MKKLVFGGVFSAVIWLYFTVCWIVNIVQLCQCDFASPWREEIIHAIGAVTVLGSGVTVWM